MAVFKAWDDGGMVMEIEARTPEDAARIYIQQAEADGTPANPSGITVQDPNGNETFHDLYHEVSRWEDNEAQEIADIRRRAGMESY